MNRKITDIDRTGFLDASVLGETVHPQELQYAAPHHGRGRGTVIEEQEQFARS